MKQVLIILSLLIVLLFSYLYTINQTITVSFDTDGGSTINEIKIKKGSKLKLPNNPKKENYRFIKWEYQGQPFKNHTKVIDSITLKAIYEANNKVKVTFDTDGGSIVGSQTVLFKHKLNPKKIEEPTKEGYIFDGWYYKDKPFDFATKITKDIKLSAHYKKAGVFISNSYKIGDKVLITGNYASSTYDTYGYHTKAIGWIRTILYIYKNTNYPYQVGNNEGTTGFFKAESLKLQTN